MKELIAEMHRAMMNEYKRAEKAHGGTFHSAHEAYAVVLEEVEEVRAEMEAISRLADGIWMATRNDMPPMTGYKNMLETALQAAAECIQVAAMCRKALLGECCVGEAE